MIATRFMMVGGFLGAGKTTTLAWLARHYRDAGHSVGVITNDQADDLVDTQNLLCQGLDVQQVSGACFCCRFDELVDRIAVQRSAPDIILAEPVGSCTDLVATVIKPLQRLYGDSIAVAPFPVLFKPAHGLDILNGKPSVLGEKGAYIFRKQLEEADVLVINRADQFAPAQLAQVQERMAQVFHGIPLLTVSARTGMGMDALAALLQQDSGVAQRVLDLDYDLYAEGEAEMGWLNHAFRLQSGVPFGLDEVLLQLLKALASRLAEAAAQVAHVKMVGVAGGAAAVVNHVGGDSQPELSLPSRHKGTHADVVLNARVATEPQKLSALTSETLRTLATRLNLEMIPGRLQALAPGGPKPTHRDTAA